MYQQLPLVWKFYYQVRKVLIHKITVGLAPAKLALLHLSLQAGEIESSNMTGLIDLSTGLISAVMN